MIVCVCNRVSDRDIQHHVAQGCHSWDELQMATGVATCCGCCTDCAREVFDGALSQQRAAQAARHIPIAVAEVA